MQDEIRQVSHDGEEKIGLVLHNKLIGFLWIISDSVYFMDIDTDWTDPTKGYSLLSDPVKMPSFDKLIQFSPFEDKNGRLLKEGDRVKNASGATAIVCIEKNGTWIVKYSSGYEAWLEIKAYQLEYTGSIFLED